MVQMGTLWGPAVLAIGLATAFEALGCGAGTAARAVRPPEHTAGEALDRDAVSSGPCREVPASSEPLIVDWEAHQRADVEEAMSDGVAVVAYDCKSLRLLRGCSVDGAYRFMSVSRKEEVVQLDDADEVRANLPSFGVAVLQNLGGDMQRGSSLDVAMVLVGKKRTTVGQVPRAALRGGAACVGATHFVRGAFVGAFAMGLGSKGQVSATAAVFNGSSKSQQLGRYRDGEPDACTQIQSGAAAPPDACSALVRLELIALDTAAQASSAAGGPQQVTPTAEAGCAAGLVLTNGKCATPSPAMAHVCRVGDLDECTAQCQHGNTPSCTILGSMYESGTGASVDFARALSLYQRACDAGGPRGCEHLGFMLEYGRGTAKDPARAGALYAKACDAGEPGGCAMLGTEYENGTGTAPDAAHALRLYERACNGGDAFGCKALGTLYFTGRGATKDAARAVGLFKLSCDGGSAIGCTMLGIAVESGNGTAADLGRAVALYARACDQGSPLGCKALGYMFEAGRGVSADPAKALALYGRACDGNEQEGCVALGTFYERGLGVPMDAGRALSLYKRACDAGQPRGCAQLKRLGK
jgi:uncharacterized protein